MNYKEVMSELESLGSEQTRKTYRRHGVSNEVYGVSYAHLERLKKKIKVDHELATTTLGVRPSRCARPVYQDR